MKQKGKDDASKNHNSNNTYFKDPKICQILGAQAFSDQDDHRLKGNTKRQRSPVWTLEVKVSRVEETGKGKMEAA